MTIAIVDIGSNTIRMNAYSIAAGGRPELVVSRKIMAGIACYISKKKVMDESGIGCLCAALADIKSTVDRLGIGRVAAFATASLRNAGNSAAVLARIAGAVGWRVDVLSGEDEAKLGFAGVRGCIQARRGLLVDIGGGSTEATVFKADAVKSARSFNIGSLNLYKRCVANDILPGRSQRRAMAREIAGAIDRAALDLPKKTDTVVGIGGTARAVLKLARNRFGLGAATNTLTDEQFRELANVLFSRTRKAVDLIVRTCPQRAHTIVPGTMIMLRLVELAAARRLEICSAGLREGYLAAILARSRPGGR
ncbi:MAG: hypothetical protein ACI4Q3_01015 [Kiritimatiellia bacterium]